MSYEKSKVSLASFWILVSLSLTLHKQFVEKPNLNHLAITQVVNHMIPT